MFPQPAPPIAPSARWRDGLRHALDVAIAFATLADAEPPAPSAPTGHSPGVRPAPLEPSLAQRVGAAAASAAAHPHRRALHAPARSRRPGTVRAAPQPCLTPLPARHAERSRT